MVPYCMAAVLSSEPNFAFFSGSFGVFFLFLVGGGVSLASMLSLCPLSHVNGHAHSFGLAGLPGWEVCLGPCERGPSVC